MPISKPAKPAAPRKPAGSSVACSTDALHIFKLGAALRGMPTRRYIDEVLLTLAKSDNRRFIVRVAENLNTAPDDQPEEG